MTIRQAVTELSTAKVISGEKHPPLQIGLLQ